MSSIKHVAIIMDGNGRWANRRLRPRIWGHVRGSGVVSDIVKTADDLGISALTLYAFSTENWSRPLEEVSTLFKLLKKFLVKEKDRLLLNNVKFKVIGDIRSLPSDTIELIEEVEKLTRNASGLLLTFAFNYGGRAEIVRAINSLQIENPDKLISEDDLARSMYRPESGDVDLMIRTGGEQRISNFMLWQSAYAELFFTPTKWPDFTPEEFRKIIDSVSGRERRFGATSSQVALKQTVGQAEINRGIFSQGTSNHV
jgi:undecaprenyl diphosphate synthase